MKVGIIGAGAMGTGIAQVAAMAQHAVIITDKNEWAISKSKESTFSLLDKLESKGKIENSTILKDKMSWSHQLEDLAECDIVIEAIIEKIEVKKEVFATVEKIVKDSCILASNTSSLSITSIAAACLKPNRVMGLHFFNPATLMPLVEIIPAIQTDIHLAAEMTDLMLSWGKKPVLAKDTPGFIVNRVARPFYGEAMRILEEGQYSIQDIDKAMTEYAGFRMGPFTLMDYIGHDVNYVVTQTVFESFFYDPRYKPSFSQKRLLEANWLGKKNGRGFYNYNNGDVTIASNIAKEEQKQIAERIIVMLINEAVDALFLKIASAADLEVAMTQGVNYPKGLLQWCDDMGADYVLAMMDSMYDTYREDRYRASPLLRRYAAQRKKFLV